MDLEQLRRSAAEIHRAELLHRVITNGEQTLPYDIARNHYFYDLPMDQWCIDHSIRIEIESFNRPARPSEQWSFVNFKLITDAEL